MDCYWQVDDHIEIRSLWSDKMEILSSYSYVSTIVWWHHLDFNETLKEKAKWELHKNTTVLKTNPGSSPLQNSNYIVS